MLGPISFFSSILILVVVLLFFFPISMVFFLLQIMFPFGPLSSGP